MAILSLAMFPAAVLACLQAFSNFRQLSELTADKVLQAAVLSTKEEENVIVAARRLLKTLAVLPEIAEPERKRCSAILKSVLSTSPFYSSLSVTNARGDVVCSSAPLAHPLNIANRPWYRQAVDRGVFTVMGDAQDIVSNTKITAIALPTFDQHEKFRGALFLALRTQWLRELLIKTGTPETANVALIDREGNILAADPPRTKQNNWLPASGIVRSNLTSTTKAVRLTGHGFNSEVLAIAPLLQDEIYVVVGSAAGVPATGSGWRLVGAIGFPLGMWFIALVVAWFAIDRLVLRPVLQLKQVAAAFAGGNRDARVANGIDLPTEIRQLGHSVNLMADNMGQHEQDLQKAVDEQRTLLKELHHRVKNNLQVITSLLNLQIRAADGGAEIQALKTTQNRIYALARVHDHLYRGQQVSRLPLDRLLPEIAEHLRQSRHPHGGSLSIHYDIDPLEAGVNRAVPMALLLTEAVSNAIDPSPHEGESSHVWISLKRSGDGGAVFTIETDNQACTVGGDDLSANLVAGFVKQLGARSEVDAKKGHRLRVCIPTVH